MTSIIVFVTDKKYPVGMMNPTNNLQLIEKYNQPGPRYTSYPAVPHWDIPPEPIQWIQFIKQDGANVDLYIHIPFCQSLCFYCGCNRVVTKNFMSGYNYVSYLKKEWNLYLKHIPELKINSIHLGGGSPTFLQPVSIKELLSTLRPYYNDNFSGAVEIDPRITTRSHIDTLVEHGITRFSLGIQDFDPVVQKVINRVQPFHEVEDCINLIRRHNVESINFDLIHGLPLQTISSITLTIDKVLKLKPNTIALYSYAHVPWVAKAQKKLEKFHIPSGIEKRALYEQSKKLLSSHGYQEIGLDHFALETDPLCDSYKNRTLKRNFMGYTREKSNVVLGLGATSISNTTNSYVQNIKDIKDYQDHIKSGHFPLAAGHILSKRDKIVTNIIQDIMCGRDANLSEILDDCSNEERETIYKKLSIMESDHLIQIEKNILSVTSEGSPFLRNICMVFDHHLKETNRFSKTI